MRWFMWVVPFLPACDFVFLERGPDAMRPHPDAGMFCVQDEFADNVIATDQWTIDDPDGIPVAVSEQADHFEVRLVTNLDGDNYNGLTGQATFDLYGAAAEVHVVPSPAASGAEMFYELVAPNGDSYSIDISSNMVFADVSVGDSTDPVYMPIGTRDRYFRIIHRADTDTVSFEVSIDSGSWRPIRDSVGVRIPLEPLRVHLSAGTYRSQMLDPGVAKFDYIRVGTICP